MSRSAAARIHCASVDEAPKNTLEGYLAVLDQAATSAASGSAGSMTKMMAVSCLQSTGTGCGAGGDTAFSLVSVLGTHRRTTLIESELHT